MLRSVGRGPMALAIGGGVFVLAVAFFSRVGAAVEPQRSAAPAPRSVSMLGTGQPAPARRQAPASRAPMVDYAREVEPILSENCLECHSQDKRKGGLSLANYGDVLEGGKDGAVVRPGNGAGSMMIARVKGELGDRMPLDELPLSDQQIDTLR